MALASPLAGVLVAVARGLDVVEEPVLLPFPLPLPLLELPVLPGLEALPVEVDDVKLAKARTP
jgi:hypothetical protein